MALELLKKMAAGLGRGDSHRMRWHAPISLDLGLVRGACFAMDRHGRGLALWENAGKLWTKPLGPGMQDSLSRLPLGDGKDPRIAVNLEGRGVAIWTQEDGLERLIIGMPFDPTASSQQSTRTLFRTLGSVRDIQVTVDRRGSALVVWSHESEGNWEILAKHFDVRAKTWDQEPTRLGPEVRHSLQPRMAMNRRGQAVVVWEEETDQQDGLVATFYLPSINQWSDHPVPVAPGTSKEYQAAMDHAGNVMVLWVNQDYGKRPSLTARLYHAEHSEWNAPVVLATAQSFKHVRLAMTGTGEALAVWLQSEGTTLSFLHSKAYRNGGWEPQVTRLDGEGGRVTDFSMTLGAKGLAGLFCLMQGQDAYSPLVRSRSKTWDPTTPVGPNSKQPQHHPVLSLCPKGSVAIWQVGSGAETRLVLAMQR
jgi:uncharacterized protein YheU (UPF0270 family)